MDLKDKILQHFIDNNLRIDSKYSVFSSCLDLGIKNAILDIEIPEYHINLIEYYIDKKFDNMDVLDESFSGQVKIVTLEFFQSILIDGIFGLSVLDFVKKKPLMMYKICDKIINKTSHHDMSFSFYSKRLTLSIMINHILNQYNKSENLEDLVYETIDKYKIINKIKQKVNFFKRCI